MARHVLRLESGGREDVEALLTGSERAFRTLGQHLARRIGVLGCHALVARALTLTAREFPFMGSVRVAIDPAGQLDGLRDSLAGVSAAAAADGLTALLVSVLGLLASFIGEELTRRLLRQAWPAVPWEAQQ